MANLQLVKTPGPFTPEVKTELTRNTRIDQQ
jgi:hypothetical protein